MREHLRKKQQRLQENVESFATFYRYLQSCPTEEAQAFFTQIRNGFTLEAALKFVEAQDESPPLEDDNPFSARASWSQQVHDCNLVFEQEALLAAASEVAAQGIRDGVECYFATLGTMFPVFTTNEVQEIVATFFGRSSDTLADQKVAYGELLAICAVGFQYDRQRLPNGSSSVCTPFYRKARLFLDYVIEKAPLRAMRMCCCLAIYNVIAKSSLAVSYTDWGITLASTEGLLNGHKPGDLSDDAYTSFLRTFRALVTVRGWVTATLGHIPSPEVSWYIQQAGEQMDSTAQTDINGQHAVIDILQQHMARITIIKGNILRTVACFRTLSPAILSRMQEDLDVWRSGLPRCMRLEILIDSCEILPDQRRVAFYMHLFYMSALILKARALLSNQMVTPQSICPEAAAAIMEGLDAARSSARLLRLIYEEKAVVKNCWLTMHQCYVAFLTLNYAAVKNVLGSGDPNIREKDQILATTCLNVLELCATKDKIGHSFHTRLLSVQNILTEHLPRPIAETSESRTNEECAGNDAYLFVETQGDAPLHRLMHDLLIMLCYPLTLLNEGTDEGVHPLTVKASVKSSINFTHHLGSPFNMDEDDVPSNLFPPVATLKELRDYESEEGFIGGSVPYSWRRSVWNHDSGVGNTS